MSVKPGKNETVWISEKLGGSIDANYICTQEFDSVVVDVSSGKILTFDLMNIDSWVRQSKDGRHAEENCTAEIFDTDFQ